MKPQRNRIVIVVMLLALLVVGNAAVAALTDEQLREVQFVQYPGRQLPLELEFMDADGATLRLKDCFQGKPVVLVPGYFRCRMLCEGVSDGLIHALQSSRLEAGKDFRVVFVSIDPNEPMAEVRAKKKTFLKRYARPDAEAGCDFLVGKPEPIKALMDSIGYRYQYDPESREFAHPAGIVVVRPDGKISRYFLGISFSETELEKAITAAAKMDEPLSKIEQFAMLCFHYNPIRSPYGALVLNIVRGLGILTFAGLILLVVRARRSRKEKIKPPGDAP